MSSTATPESGSGAGDGAEQSAAPKPPASFPSPVPRTHRRTESLSIAKRVGLWASFLFATLLLAAVNTDVLEQRKVLLNIADILQSGELYIWPPVQYMVLTGWFWFTLIGLIFMYALRAASGGDFYDYLGQWWPCFIMVPYFFGAPIVDLGRTEIIISGDDFYFGIWGLDLRYGKLTYLLGLSLSAGLLIRRFILVCVNRGVKLTFPKPFSKKGMAVVLMLGVLIFSGHLYNSYKRWANYKIYATDTGIYSQMLFMINRGEWWHVPVYTTNENRAADFGDNFNAEHYMPTMALLAPLFKIWSHPMWLWIVQHALVVASGFLLLLLTGRLTGSSGLALCVAISFLLHPQIHRGMIEDFHPDAFVPFFFFAMMLSYHKRNFLWYGISMALALGCKEDVAIYCVLIGLWMMIGQRDWKWGIITFVIGLGWYIIASKVIIATLRAGDPMRVLERYSWLHPEGRQPDGMGELIKFFLLYPETWLDWINNQLRWLTPIRLLIPLYFLALLRPSFFIVLAPLTAAHYFSSWGDQSRLWRYHGVAVIPFYYYAGVLGLQFLLHKRVVFANAATADARYPEDYDPADDANRERDTRLEPRESFWRPFWKGGGFYPIPRLSSSSQTALARGLAVGILILGIMQYREYSEGPFGGRFDKKPLQLAAHYFRADEVLEMIPDDAIVIAQNKFAPRLTHTHVTYLFPDIEDRPDATHILIDVRGHRWPLPLDGDAFPNLIYEIFTNGEWGVVNDENYDGIVLFERGADTSDNARVLKELEKLDWIYYKDEILWNL